jgi:hypothetical protein
MDIISFGLSMAYNGPNSKIFQTTESSQFDLEMEYICSDKRSYLKLEIY